MKVTDWANIARCAEQRMEQLWLDACAATGNDWRPFHERRWREHQTYVAMQSHAYAQWRQALAAYA